MPQTHFSSGIAFFVSDEEVENPRFQEIYAVKWQRMADASKSYKSKLPHAMVKRNLEDDGYQVTLYTEKRNLLDGVTVAMTETATREEIVRQHGEAM
jgi:hypothetical protein